jgi:hypothetical protein
MFGGCLRANFSAGDLERSADVFDWGCELHRGQNAPGVLPGPGSAALIVISKGQSVMKRQWIPRLAVAVVMALLAATPGFGDDANAAKNKKPVTDMKKSAPIVVKPANGSAKVQQVGKTTPPKVSTAPTVVAKPLPDAKPSVNAKPIPNAKTAPKLVPVVNSKPVPVAKPAVKPQPIVSTKPIVNTKPVVSTKPVSKSDPKVVSSKPVTKSAPTAVAKPAANVKAISPVKSVAYSKPKTVTKFAVKSNTRAAIVRPMVNKTIVTTPNTVAAQSVPMATAGSFQLPAGYEKNLTSDQRNKARTIVDRYSVQIASLESQLSALKAGRDKELSALVKPQGQTQLAKTQSQPKPTTNVTKPAATTSPVKPVPNKTGTAKAENKSLAAVPVVKEKLPKKSGQK